MKVFELNLAIAINKKVAIVRAIGTKPIFDVNNLLRVFDYNPQFIEIYA
jgi:hypothetical protein